MAIIIDERTAEGLTGTRRFWTYCGFDSTVTREVFDTLNPQLDDVTRRLYRYSLGLQAPALAMGMRGIRVNLKNRDEAVVMLEADYVNQARDCDAILGARWDGTELNTGACPRPKRKDGRHSWPKGVADSERRCECCGVARVVRAEFNPNSPPQADHALYEILGVPVQTNKTGERSTDEECLERVARKWPTKPGGRLAAGISEARGVRKQIGVLRSGVSEDGRMHFNIVVGGPWTGRFASQKNAFSEGTNIQNIAEKLRFIFEADPGQEMFYADLEQAESCCVAHLAGDEAYIQAHSGGDVHTAVSRLVWPELPWNGDLAKDKLIASTTYPDWDPAHSYRDNCKRLQHGSNYLMTIFGVARIAHIPQAAARDFQERYFDKFRSIKPWHYAVIARQKEMGQLTTHAGRRFVFMGRPWDPHTHRQAVASEPQSMVADILNCALWEAFYDLDLTGRVQLLAQIHDAILGQYRRGDKATPRKLLEMMRIPVHIIGIDGVSRTMIIPVDMKVGLNWSKRNLDPKKGRLNPDGLA